MKFHSKLAYVGKFKSDWCVDTVKNEPMFFNCDLSYAYTHGGAITRSFIETLPEEWISCNPVLDSRVHMLMKGWYPCIPGWHHDDVPRSTETGQPNYSSPEYFSEHLIGLVNGEICPTLFVQDTVEVSDPDPSILQYERWHKEIEKISPNTVTAESGKYIQFDANTFHRGTKAISSGWRWFIRLSRNTARQQNMTNEIRRQVQVYLENPIQGW